MRDTEKVAQQMGLSRFALVNAVSVRCRQLAAGAEPTVIHRGERNPVSQALDEFARDTLTVRRKSRG